MDLLFQNSQVLPELSSKRISKYPSGRLFHIVSLGSGDMPGHDGQLSSKDRWQLVQYVQTLQKK